MNNVLGAISVAKSISAISNVSISEITDQADIDLNGQRVGANRLCTGAIIARIEKKADAGFYNSRYVVQTRKMTKEELERY